MNREQRLLLGGIWNQYEPPAGQQTAPAQQPAANYQAHLQPWPPQAEPNSVDNGQTRLPPLLQFNQLDTSAWQEEHIKKALTETSPPKDQRPGLLKSARQQPSLAEVLYGEGENIAGANSIQKEGEADRHHQDTVNFLTKVAKQSPVTNKISSQAYAQKPRQGEGSAWISQDRTSSYGLVDSAVRRYTGGRGVSIDPFKKGGMEYPEPEDLVKPVVNYAGRVVAKSWQKTSQNNFSKVYEDAVTGATAALVASFILGGPEGVAAMSPVIASAGISGAATGFVETLFITALEELNVPPWIAETAVRSISWLSVARTLRSATNALVTSP